jgi:ubiquinone/menaquinone biosynthesis C-methylase UbiE
MTAPNHVDLQRVLYDSRNPTRRWMHRQRRDWVQDALKRHAPVPCRLAVEVGIGSGVHLPALAQLGEKALGIEFDQHHLTAVQSKGCLLAGGDVRRLPLADASVDLLLFSEVLEHVTGTAAILTELRRVLRPGGALVLTTPQRYSLLETTARVALSPSMLWLTRAVYREPVLPMGHINLQTHAGLRRALVAAGLNVREAARFGLYLPLMAELGGGWGCRLAQRLSGSVARGPLAGLLWTQAYVLEASA